MVEDNAVSSEINQLLHSYSPYIVGRMGLPHAREDLSVISIVVDAPGDVISALAGKLGRIKGVTSKTIYSRSDGGGRE